MNIKIVVIGFITVMLIACGKDSVSINQEYLKKIVMNAFLYPHQPVDRIRITRNWPLNVTIEYDKVVLSNADVVITDLTDNSNIPYTLTFNQDSNYFQYNGNDLIIEYGGRYKLDVSANVDGEELSASSITRIPLAGFKIIDSLSTDSIYFYETGHNGTVKQPVVTFYRSENTEIYVFSVQALDASITLDNFIFNHPWMPSDPDEEDILENFNAFKYSHEGIFNTPPESGVTEWEVMKYHLWFYGWYRIIVYAGDKNYKDYYLTQADTQEMDGNFHEPVLHIDGDGLGIFGSVIADTLYFKLLEN
jgi:hypothetical protein